MNQYQSDTIPILKYIKQNEDIVPKIFIYKKHWNSFDTIDLKPIWALEFILQNNISKPRFIDTSLQFIEKKSDILSFLFFSIPFVLLTLSKITAWKTFIATIESIIYETKFRYWLQQELSNFKVLFSLLLPSSLLFFSIYIWQFVKYFFTPKLPDFEMYIVIVFILLIFYTIRHLLIKFSSYIYKTTEATIQYQRNISIFLSLYSFTGVFLLPFILFSNLKLWFLIPYIIFTIESFRFVKSIQIARKQTNYNLFYFFLYFCTIEIIPALLLYRLLFLFIE